MKNIGGLFFQKPRDDIQQNTQYYRNQDRACKREIKATILSLDADIAGQSSERDSKFRGKVYPSANEEDNNSAEHEITSDGFHNFFPSVRER